MWGCLEDLQSCPVTLKTGLSVLDKSIGMSLIYRCRWVVPADEAAVASDAWAA